MDNFSCLDPNLSAEELTTEVWEFNRDSPAARYSITVICALLMAFGLPLNIVVIASIVYKKLYIKQPTTVLLLNLSVTNILVCVFVIPFNIWTGITGEFNIGRNDSIRCKMCLTGVIFITFTYVSLNNFAFMSVDRLIYIKKAMQYQRWITTKRITVAMMSTWLFAIAIVFPTLFGFGELYFSSAIGICILQFNARYNNLYYLLLLLILSLVPLTTLTVANTWVTCIAQKYLIKRFMLCKMKENWKEINKQEFSIAQVNLIKVYVAVCFTYGITWFPSIVRLIFGLADVDSFHSTTQLIGIVAYLALLSQVVIHPTLQSYLIRSVRENIVVCCTKIITRLRRNYNEDETRVN